MIGTFYFLPIAIFLIILYLLSYFLYTDGTITLRSYKLIWISVLTVCALIVGLSGILMEIYINLQLLPINNTLLFWHVEAGILTFITGIFHIHVYWKNFKNIILK